MMRDNLIAVLIFIGFIGAVLGIGYAVSADSIPLTRGSVPQMSTNGGRSVTRAAQSDDLQVNRMESGSVGRVNGQYGSNYSVTVSSPNSGGSGVMPTSSSQRLQSYGGGSTSGGSGSSGSARANGGQPAGGSGSSGILLSYRRSSNSITDPLAESPNSLIESKYDEGEVKLGFGDSGNTGGSDKPNPWEDPYSTPIGNIPFIMLLIAGGYAIKKKSAQK